MTAEVGGGRLTLSGDAGYRDTLRFGLRANDRIMRMRVQPGVSAIANANIQLTGGAHASIVTGTVTFLPPRITSTLTVFLIGVSATNSGSSCCS